MLCANQKFAETVLVKVVFCFRLDKMCRLYIGFGFLLEFCCIMMRKKLDVFRQLLEKNILIMLIVRMCCLQRDVLLVDMVDF